MKIQIVILKPEGAVHAECFAELAETLVSACRSLGYESCKTYNEFAKDGINIILGWHQTPDMVFPPHSIIFNLEQLDKPNSHLIDRLKSIQYRYKLWDYSSKNTKILRDAGITAPIELIKIGYAPELTRIARAKDQDIDVLFYGSINPRRKKVLLELEQKGLKVCFAYGIYGQRRDDLIARAKVVLNMHFYETNIFEMVRVSYLLSNSVTVVSEIAEDEEIDPDILEVISCARYDGLVEACIEAVRAHDYRLTLGKMALRAMKKRPQSRYLLEPLQRAMGSTTPKIINLGSGKDWKQECLNVDVDNQWEPDLLLDISKPLHPYMSHTTKWFGTIDLKPGYFDEILANDVLEHLPNLSQAMTNCLTLLRDGGRMRINVPYDLSLGAWQDPTHVRAFNEMSWTYYTEWFWYLNWEESRFEIEHLGFGISKFGERLKERGVPEEDLPNYARAIDNMLVTLVKRPLTTGEKILGKKMRGQDDTPLPMPDASHVPVFIINRNRCRSLKRMVDWLVKCGTKTIYIIDNGSKFIPTLNYYGELPPQAKVICMGNNYGPWVVWEENLLERFKIETPYIVTDADLDPEECPMNLNSKLLGIIETFPESGKAGPGLRIDNIPDYYRHKSTVIRWESQFRHNQITQDLFQAPIDTTYAIYPAGAKFSNGNHNLRLNRPYEMVHTPWLCDENNLDEEEKFYREHADQKFINWSMNRPNIIDHMNTTVVYGVLGRP